MKTITLNPDSFFQKLNKSEKNIYYFKNDEKQGWTTIIAFNPSASFSGSIAEQGDYDTFIQLHNKKCLLGYFSYDNAYEFFKVPQTAKNDLNLPDINICAFENYITFDGDKATIHSTDPSYILLVKTINQRKIHKTLCWNISAFEPESSKEEYRNAFDRIQEYIRSGDIYQINLTHRFNAMTDLPARELFMKVAKKNPVNFLAYIEADGFEILSASPERFVKINNNNIETCPVKGTRPRGQTKEEDQQLQQELQNNEKEKAELDMITDLLRNDLGKICRINSVRVKEHRILSAHPNVWHTHTKIIGKLMDRYSPLQALISMMPGGSITGCPKKRAIEIIDELEPLTRGIYTGTIFNCFNNQHLDSSIAIRTMIKKDQKLFLQAGGGIVVDSEKHSEYQETLHKAKAFFNLKEPDFFTTFRVTHGDIHYLSDHLQRIEDFTKQQNHDIDLSVLEKKTKKFFATKTGKGRIISQNYQISFTYSPLPVQPEMLNISLQLIDKPLGTLKKYPFDNRGFIEGEEIVFIDKNSNEVLEGNHTNIFIKINNEYFTPPLNGKILAGITRKYFIKELREKGIPVNEIPIKPEMLKQGEIYLTNCLKGVVSGKLK